MSMDSNLVVMITMVQQSGCWAQQHGEEHA